MEIKQSDIKIYTTSQQAWDAMYTAIDGASSSIYWETYIFVDDTVGRRFINLLKQKAKAGIRTTLIADALGSFSLSSQSIKDMRRAGVDMLLFSARDSKHIRTWWKKLWTRSHRKVLIVDEHIGFIGGVNIQKSMAAWKDIHVRIKGIAVHSLLRSFARSYIIAGGKKKLVHHLLKYKFRVAKNAQQIQFVYAEPGRKRSRVRKRYVEALMKARERVILFSPYYFPDKKFLKALWHARKRGIKVDLLIPFRSDVRIASYAAYAFFSLMQQRGVRVHVMQDMMHGKGMIVDDDWAMIGSSNIDQTSFYDNYEADIHIQDKKTVHDLKTIITGWLVASRRVPHGEWNKRGRIRRTKEWIALRLYTIWHRSNEHIDTLKKRSKKIKKSLLSK